MTYIEKLDAYFDRTQDLWIRVIGMFAFVLLGIIVPMHTINQARKTEQENANLIFEIQELQNKIGFYELKYDQQQKIMAEVDCLAKNIYYEAGNQSYEGKVAVAQVTMNRVRNPEFPKTVCAVVKQKARGICQFSWVCLGRKAINSSSTAWKQSKTIAENILISKKKYGIVDKNTMYYHASYINPNWDLEKTKTIGDHIFYKGKT